MFISIEGTDGAGKSVQTKLLKDFLTSKGLDVILTRDPGGNTISEKLRDIVLDKEHTEMCFQCEALIYAAARSQMVSQIIQPALDKGYTVISDRYIDSSLVYQGYCRGLGVDEVYAINNFGTIGLIPDITFFLNLPTDIGISRKKSNGDLDRIERENNDFHEKVRDSYLQLANKYSSRIKVIDAKKTIDNIHQEITDIIKEMII